MENPRLSGAGCWETSTSRSNREGRDIIVSLDSTYENATLIFNIGNRTFQNDTLTGNRVENTTEVVLRAFLSQDSDTSEQMIRGVGIDTTKLFLKGFLTEPQFMPQNIGLGAVGTAIIDGRKGKFIIYPNIKSPYKVVNLVLGDPIRGEFQVV